MKLWADPKTLLPIRIEETMADPEMRIVMTDFQIDIELDKSLFSVDVPKGYTVRETAQFDASKKPIQYLADGLKLAAKCNDGVFPPELRGEHGIDGIILPRRGGPCEKEAGRGFEAWDGYWHEAGRRLWHAHWPAAGK